MNKQNLHKIIQDLIEVRGESGLKVTDDKLFEQACSFARGESMDKKSQHNKMTSDESTASRTNQTGVNRTTGYADKQIHIPATANQISFLRRNGVKVNKDLTKQEAFIMIRNYKKSLQKENI
jgi:hypothetical protein